MNINEVAETVTIECFKMKMYWQWRLRSNFRKCIFDFVRQTKIQISLRIRGVRSDSSLGAFWVAKHVNFLHADSLDNKSLLLQVPKKSFSYHYIIKSSCNM